MLTIALPYLPPKEFNPNSRVHWSARYRAGQKVKDDVMALVLEQGAPTEPIQKAHITITWVAKDKRRRDIDNLFSSMKAYIDGLVHAGLIADDSADHVEYTLKYERGTKDNTIIGIEEKEIG